MCLIVFAYTYVCEYVRVRACVRAFVRAYVDEWMNVRMDASVNWVGLHMLLYMYYLI
jgi:hypothetical protein